MSNIKNPIYPLLVLLVIAGSYFVYEGFIRKAPLPEGLIEANGRIEGDHVTVSNKFSGRIQELLVREGDVVRAGQTVVMMDDTQTRAKVAQARAACNALNERVLASQMAIEVLRKQVPLDIESAEAACAQSKAVLSKAYAVARQARKDALRMQKLLVRGAVPRQRTEQNELALKVAQDQAAQSGSALTGAQKQLAQARLGPDRIEVRKGELNALVAQLKQSKATLSEAESVLSDFVIKAPSNGVVVTRIANLGEVVASGAPLLDMVDLDHLYLKVYIPEELIGKVRLGLPARIYTDSFPGRPVPATVAMISSEAEFTPKEVQTQDERTKLVYAVKLYLDKNPHHFVTPGMPCDAVIRWKKNVPWEAPRW